jgi:predicted kinase
VKLFDRVEFNEELSWIDVMSDFAFLMMDMRDRGHLHFSRRLLNVYLQQTGDYEGLQVLNYYLVYRALIRAKISILRHQQGGKEDFCMSHWRSFQDYLHLAIAYSRYRFPALLINHGPSGSGKSMLSTVLVETVGAVQIRTDLERKRLFQIPAMASSQSSLMAGIYSKECSDKVYARCLECARYAFENGYPAIIDGCFLSRAHREEARHFAIQRSIRFSILSFFASESTLLERIMSRAGGGQDPSEATIEVLKHQLKTADPLDDEELKFTISFNTTFGTDAQECCRKVVDMVFPDLRLLLSLTH